jgi:uncharacterized protein (TIGR02246 family)
MRHRPFDKPLLAAVLLLAMACATASPLRKDDFVREGNDQTADRQAVQELMSGFLKAFEDLDMPRFIDCFTDRATVFFPTPEPPERFEGKKAIESHFQQVFDAIRKSSGATGPPFHHLVPEDLLIQILNPHAAVVSFHLRNSERIARRTFVLTKEAGRWRIAHLHASNVSR